jgi:carbonic anhydrase/acetyltransferase-like protein (isoleucine patch superfamily)
MNNARFTAPTAVVLGCIDVGEGTWIGNFTTLEGVNAKLSIGKNCSIADGVRIYTHSTHETTTEGKPRKVGAVTIGDNVAIGANSVVFYGASIGDGVVIPALTVVKPYMRIENAQR